MKDGSSKVRIFGSDRSDRWSKFSKKLTQASWMNDLKENKCVAFVYIRWIVPHKYLNQCWFLSKFEIYLKRLVSKLNGIIKSKESYSFIWVKWIWSKENITNVNVVSFLIISDT